MWIVATSAMVLAFFAWLGYIGLGKKGRSATKESGDESPHSKISECSCRRSDRRLPALAISAWMALLTPDRLRRIWWLAFTMVVGLFPPFCAPLERKIFDLGRFLQAQARRGILSLPTDAIELCVLLGAVLAPLVAACLAGVAAANFSQRVARRARRGAVAQSSSGARWQFSVRELLFATAALGLLLAWNARYMAGRGNGLRVESLSADRGHPRTGAPRARQQGHRPLVLDAGVGGAIPI